MMTLMLIMISEIALLFLLIYVAAATFYNLFLAVAYFLVKEPKEQNRQKLNSFAIIVPAHNEEQLISKTCESLLSIDYPKELTDIFIIADNCTDKTVEICRTYPVMVLRRCDLQKKGKGYTIDWAIDNIDMEQFDTILILDADTTVDKFILKELNKILNQGAEVIQCNNSISNRNESWFTQIIFVSRTVNNYLYHHSKYKLCLSSYLMGDGMCFKSALLKKKRWTAFSLSEDWDYFANLMDQGVKTYFAIKAIVYAQESKNLKQATTQRLRWASGRFYVVKSLGIKLLAKGIVKSDIVMADASLALIFPNWSLLINLIALVFICSLLLPATTFKTVAIVSSLSLVGLQGLLLLTGIYLSGNYWAVFKAILVAPLFLVWKMAIDILCMTGLYKGKNWIRTERHIPDKNEIKD